MPSRRHIAWMIGAAVVLLVFLEAMLVPPGEDPFSVMLRESRGVQDKGLVAGVDQPDLSVKRAAQQQWNLAEFHYMRGDYRQARAEYQRLIDEFPYAELDYGYRADDARKRLLEISAYINDTGTVERLNPNAPLSGD